MSAAFTPGPWSFGMGAGRSWNGAVIWASGLRVGNVTRAADKPTFQKEADVRLIAAAPELCEALSKLLALDLASLSLDPGVSCDADEHDAALKAAETVLAKVCGWAA